MATDGTSKLRWVVRLLFVIALLAPAVLPWVGITEIPELGTGTLVRLVGLVVITLAGAVLVHQKRLSRGQKTEADVEGTGNEHYRYAYTSQTDAAKEGDRITEEAERLVETERDADRRQDERRSRDRNHRRDTNR
jgi:hypothetical protein